MHVLIVNPASSPAFLSERFKKLNMETTAIFTHDREFFSEYTRPNPEYFDRQIFFNNEDVSPILEKLKALPPIDYVLNGNESTLELTEKLSHILKPEFANPPENIKDRLDKYHCHEALKKHHLSYIHQVLFTLPKNKNELEKMLNELKLQYPSFIKPLFSAGSMGVAKIDDFNQLKNYFLSIDLEALEEKLKVYTDTENVRKFLICEYVEGEEYFVDSVSFQGKHYISSIQKYTKKLINQVPIYRSLEIVKDETTWNTIEEYFAKAMTAIGFNNGFTHTEFFIKKNGEPVIIEVNTRVGGAHGMTNAQAEAANLPIQPQLLHDLLLNHGSIGKTYTQKRRTNTRLLILSHFSLLPLPDLAKIFARYQSVKDVKLMKALGYCHNHMPNALVDTVAFVLCAHDETPKMRELFNQEIDEILLKDEQGWTPSS